MAGIRATARPEIGLQLPTAVEASRIAPHRAERKARVLGVPLDRARLCSAQVFSFPWHLALVWDSTPCGVPSSGRAKIVCRDFGTKHDSPVRSRSLGAGIPNSSR